MSNLYIDALLSLPHVSVDDSVLEKWNHFLISVLL